MAHTLLVVEAAGKQPPKPLTSDYVERKRGGAWASEPDVSPDGSIAFISDRMKPYEYDVFITNRHGTTVKPLGITKVSHYNQCPTFLSGGRSLLFLAGESNPSLRQVDIEGKDSRCIAVSTLFKHPLRWKPNR